MIEACRAARGSLPARLRAAALGAGGCADGDREAAAPALEEAARLAADHRSRAAARRTCARSRGARACSSTSAEAGAGRAGIDAFGLTQREREVLDLLAEGRSNGQIAEELFITRKTASVHVSNILGKLGVASRGEATAMAHRLRAPGRPA